MADPPEHRFEEDLYGADPDEVLAFLRALPDDVDAAMVVGHNPTAHALSQGLLSPRDKKGRQLAVRHGFPTCALGVYTFKADRWADVAAEAKLVAIMAPPYGGRPAGPSGLRPGERRMAASPWPPPPHSATAAVDAPRRRSSSSAVSATPRPRHADRVAERDGAAVDVDLVLVDAEVVHRGQADGGEGLVDLEEVDGPEVDAGLAGRLDDGPRGLGQQRVVRARPPCRSRRSGRAG